MEEGKTLFTAVFMEYKILASSLTEAMIPGISRCARFKNVRTRNGELIKHQLELDAETTRKIQGNLTFGEYISFLADIKFQNIKIQYPHGGLDNGDITNRCA